MWETLGKNSSNDIQISETDDALPTQTLLQVIKAFTPDDIEDNYPKLKKSAVTAYSSKAGVLSEFRKMMEEGKNFEEILDFYHSFAGSAWKEYISWKSDFEWINFQKKYEKIGKLNSDKTEIDIQWAIICPALYGLKSFFVSDTGKWKLKYPDNFNKKEYMQKVMDLFKDPDYGNGDLQTFAKDRSVYSELKLFTLKKLN